MNEYEQLKARADALAKEVERARCQERQGVLDDVREKVGRYGLQVVEIYGEAQVRALQCLGNRRKIAPKYRDPESGATWTGRGLEPRWIRGRNRREFLIEVSQDAAAKPMDSHALA
ncbi:histone family protein nucleoid-structuring protein H-NS [Burkholderia ambifaria IOP40-10]|uniref:Histone family protein nucleoid-structuring protein H-NS n=1 Tax=Burkholderia ambifaria IOP40-10 TaxID=396596 RepID=B1FNZ3_9BURK|nr:H-NS histone family protein [Burkholderia ambifaria]EDT00718.1 histone family protein nucleoid-structuring protein H-NS [Burkholderia ambifaria IOP40-10]